MFNLAEYRNRPDRLADVLPWAALVAPGVVLNKDGSFQRTLQFRGPDLESATQSQLVAATARLNNILKRLGSGWALYIEAKRQPYQAYPDQSYFPDPVSWLIDTERRETFSNMEGNFESKFYLTLQYLPPAERHSKLRELFISSDDSNDEQGDYKKDLEFFLATTDRLAAIMDDFMYESFFLDDDQVLTYLHSLISTSNHPVKRPGTPMYLDALLADTPLLGGLEPRLGDQHIGVVSILSFPAMTMPALLDQLNHLPLSYRWVTRYIPLDKTDAESQLKSYKRRWFAKRKGMLNMLQEVFTKSESQLVDTASVEKARDADEASQELAEDYVAFGYYTATIVVQNESKSEVEESIKEIERVVNGLGLTTIYETFNAVEAWLSSLPGQAYANVRKPLLHTLNLAHLMPFSAVWPGPEKDEYLNGPPLMYTHTHGRTPFRLVNHIGDVGHQFIIGPTGAGKSVLLCMMALQFRRYQDAQVFVFDKGGSFMAPTFGVNGGYYQLGDKQYGLAFQPLAHIDQEQERLWATEWLQGLLINEQLSITPDIKNQIWEALVALADLPQEQRTLTGLKALLQDQRLRQALGNYTIEGAFGYLLDADEERLGDANWQCYEMEELMSSPSVVPPVLSYLFHRLEQRFDGRPTLLVLDEAWLFLDHPMFASQIKNWLKTLRKQGVSVVFATQSVEDALNSSIAPAILESCPSRILLPNDRILEPSIRESYESLGLNERQINILAHATPKQQYYFQSRDGNRLFDLELGPIALAFCAANQKKQRQRLHELYFEKDSYAEFLKAYLSEQNIDWAWDVIQEVGMEL